MECFVLKVKSAVLATNVAIADAFLCIKCYSFAKSMLRAVTCALFRCV